MSAIFDLKVYAKKNFSNLSLISPFTTELYRIYCHRVQLNYPTMLTPICMYTYTVYIVYNNINSDD